MEEQEYFDPKAKEREGKDYSFKAIPTVKYYQKTYANSLANNDQKAVKIFKEYEPRDKISRFKTELLAISQERVSPELCAQTVGPKRQGRFGSYSKWAKICLSLLNSSAC